MDVGRIVVTATRMYVIALLILFLAIGAWIFDVFENPSLEGTGIGIALGGFGALVGVTLFLIYLAGE